MRRHAPTVYVSVGGTKLRETELAVHFRFITVRDFPLATPMVAWIPKSQISKRFTDPLQSGKDTMMVAEWILEKSGILEAPLAEEQEPEIQDTYDQFDDDIPF